VTRHFTSEQLIALAEDAGTKLSESQALHLGQCAECRHQVADLRAMMTAVEDATVPEPSPLFWDHFSARVRDAVAAEQNPPSLGSGPWPWFRAKALWLGAAVVAVLAVAVIVRIDRNAPSSSVSISTSGTEAVDPFGAVEDASLSLVADLAADLDWEAATEAGFTTHVSVDAVMQLTDAERRELRQLLQGELGRTGA
jgi:hypothetical protein